VEFEEDNAISIWCDGPQATAESAQVLAEAIVNWLAARQHPLDKDPEPCTPLWDQALVQKFFSIKGFS